MKKNVILISMLFLSIIELHAQVGVGTNAPKAALDIESNNAGILIPRIHLTSLNATTPVLNPNTNTNALEIGTLVFNTNDALVKGFYYWDGTKWVAIHGATNTEKNTLDQAYDQGGPGAGRIIVADSGAVSIINNSSTAGTPGLNVNITNTDHIAISANMPSSSTGVGYYVDDESVNNPYSAIQVTTVSNLDTYAGIKSISNGLSDAIRATNNSNGVALRAETSGTNHAVYAFGSQATDVIKAVNTRTNGGSAIDATGAIAIRAKSSVAQGSGISSYYTGPSGIAGNFNATGDTPVGVRSWIATNIKAGIGAKGNSVGAYGEFIDNQGAAFFGHTSHYDRSVSYCTVIFPIFYEIYRNNNTLPKPTFYNVIGEGSNATIINHKNQKHAMVAVSAPQDTFQDSGVGKLVNGKAKIDIDPILASNIVVDKQNPLKVFVQLEGDCNGVYVTNKTANGFEVVELNKGKSNVSFSYTLMATRKNTSVTNKTTGETTMLDYESRFKQFNNTENVLKINDVIESNEDKVTETKILKTKKTKS